MEMNSSVHFEFSESDDLISLVSKARRAFHTGTIRNEKKWNK